MSVNRSGGGPVSDDPLPDAFDDYEHQHIQQTARHQNPGASEGVNGINGFTDPANGLDRNEYAELRYMVVRSHIGYPDEADFAASNEAFNFRWGMQATLGQDDAGWIRDNDQDYEAESDTGGRNRVDDDRDVIYLGYGSTTAAPGGQVQSRGGVDGSQEVIDFRQMYGQGPIVSPAEDLTFSSMFRQVSNGSGTNCVQLLTASLYWDVFETDREIRRG